MKNNQKIVFFDVDNTIVDGYTQKYFVKYLSKIKAINIMVLFLSYLWFLFYKLHIVKDVDKAINFYISFLNNWDKDRLFKLVDIFFNLHIKNKIYKDIKILIDNYKIEGAIIVLISTSLEPIVKRIAYHLEIKNYIATKLEVMDDLYTGKINGRAVSGAEKLKLVKDFLALYKNQNIETYFYSDHFSDEVLLSFVDYPFVVNPDKILYNKAMNRNWPIIKVK